MKSVVLRVFLVLCTLALLLCMFKPAQAQAYCSITDVKINALANGVQIQVKADGILNWRWETGSENAAWGVQRSEVTVRFKGVMIGVAKTQYAVDQDPVSNISLMTPQDATDGRTTIMRITMTTPSAVQASLSEDRLTFLLTVRGKRTVDRIIRENSTDLQQGQIFLSTHDDLISVRAIKANIHKVVSEIARISNISVAIDDAVNHDVSINIQDRKPLDVLRGIAAGYGLALSSVGDVYMLSEGVPADITTYQRSGTTSFSMRYLKAKDARSLLPNFLIKYVHDNPGQNAVVVTAPSQMLEKIGSNLRAIDIPPPMIMIECAVIELTDSADFDSEFNWLYQSRKFDIGADSATGDLNFRQVNSKDGLSSAIVPTPKLQAFLQALTTKGRAQVEAHPSMAAVNGKEAEIFIGSQRFIKVEVTRNGSTEEHLESVPVGVRLTVTPWTGGNNEITTSVEVEVSNIAQIDPQSGVPLLGTRRASTTLRTTDGDTIIIGGLTQRQEEKIGRHVPFLSKLPLIGSLFRSTNNAKSNTELVLLLRPRLLDINGNLPISEENVIRQRFLQPGDLGYPESNKK